MVRSAKEKNQNKKDKVRQSRNWQFMWDDERKPTDCSHLSRDLKSEEVSYAEPQGRAF